MGEDQTEHELRAAELTAECAFYQVRSKALFFWRLDLWAPRSPAKRA